VQNAVAILDLTLKWRMFLTEKGLAESAKLQPGCWIHLTV